MGVDLSDPGFWSSGLDLIERQLDDAERAARQAGRSRSTQPGISGGPGA